MKRSTCVAAAALMLTASACATDNAASPKGGKSGDLTFWMTGSQNDTVIMQSAATAYHRTHPDTKVHVQSITWDDGHAKILAAATSRSGPDIISGGLSWGIDFGSRGGMVDLRGRGAEQLGARSQRGVWKSVVSTGGAVYAVPLDLTVYLLFYRPDTLKKAGIDAPPKTWDELTEDAGRLKAAGVDHPVTVSSGNVANGWIGYFDFLKQAGGSLYDDGCTRATVDSPTAVSALRFYKDVYKKFGAPVGNFDEKAGLAKGTVGMAIADDTRLTGLDAQQPTLAGKWKTAVLPAGPAGIGSFIGGRVVGVMSYSKHVDAAVDFIKWLYTDEGVHALTRAAAASGQPWIPARGDELSRLGLPEDQATALTQTFDGAAGPPNCKGWETSQDTLTKQLQAVVVSGADPQSSLRKAAAAMNQNLK